MKWQFVRFLVSITLIMGTLWACNPFRPQIRKSPQGQIPQTFSLYTPGPERPDKWWEEFNDPELNALIEKALSGNFTLKLAWARLNQTKALSVQAGSALYPELTVTAGASRVRQRTETRPQETSQATGNGPPETDQRLTVRRIA